MTTVGVAEGVAAGGMVAVNVGDGERVALAVTEGAAGIVRVVAEGVGVPGVAKDEPVAVRVAAAIVRLSAAVAWVVGDREGVVVEVTSALGVPAPGRCLSCPLQPPRSTTLP